MIAAAGIRKPCLTFVGSAARALRPFWQIQEILRRNLEIGNIVFNSLQAKLAKWRLRFGARLGNILNRTFSRNSNTNWSSPEFSSVSGQCNIPRRTQFRLRLDW